MRRRASLLALATFVACLAGFATSEPSLTSLESMSRQPTTTEPAEVEVEAKVVEQGPLKDPVDVADLAQTGSDGAGDLALVGLALVAFGLVLVDLVSGGQREGSPRRTTPRGAARRS
jgi:LPXTG-motif cell wall-anchored protein